MKRLIIQILDQKNELMKRIIHIAISLIKFPEFLCLLMSKYEKKSQLGALKGKNYKVRYSQETAMASNFYFKVQKQRNRSANFI